MCICLLCGKSSKKNTFEIRDRILNSIRSTCYIYPGKNFNKRKKKQRRALVKDLDRKDVKERKFKKKANKRFENVTLIVDRQRHLNALFIIFAFNIGDMPQCKRKCYSTFLRIDRERRKRTKTRTPGQRRRQLFNSATMASFLL